MGAYVRCRIRRTSPFKMRDPDQIPKLPTRTLAGVRVSLGWGNEETGSRGLGKAGGALDTNKQVCRGTRATDTGKGIYLKHLLRVAGLKEGMEYGPTIRKCGSFITLGVSSLQICPIALSSEAGVMVAALRGCTVPATHSNRSFSRRGESRSVPPRFAAPAQCHHHPRRSTTTLHNIKHRRGLILNLKISP